MSGQTVLMTDTPTSNAATSAGSTRPAGEGLTDAAAVAEVAYQTSSDRQVEDFFGLESDGALTDTQASETTADEIAEP